MRKSLRDFTANLKKLIPDIPADYEISPIYKSIAGEENIRSGVLAFRNFLCQLYDCIATDADLHDIPKCNANSMGGGLNLIEDYPFIRNILMSLLNIGIHGDLNKNGDSLVIGGAQLLAISKKTRIPKVSECLRYLTNCGIEFIGIDFDMEKPDLSKAETLEISYPDSPAVLIGLKIMANAQIKSNEKRLTPGRFICITVLDNVFMPCDYKALGDKERTTVSFLEDVIKPFAVETQDFVLKLHQRLMDLGFKCKMANGRNSIMGYYFKYSYKSKSAEDKFIIRVNPIDCGIKICAENASRYTDVIEKFPSRLLDILKTGEGCCYEPARCRNNKEKDFFTFTISGKQYYKCPCAGMCSNNNFWIPLTDLTNENSQAIENWIVAELSYSV